MRPQWGLRAELTEAGVEPARKSPGSRTRNQYRKGLFFSCVIGNCVKIRTTSTEKLTIVQLFGSGSAHGALFCANYALLRKRELKSLRAYAKIVRLFCFLQKLF